MQSPVPEALLARVDAFAAAAVARAAPVRFALATSPDERAAIFRLRAATVVERGWLPPDAFPDGMERDAYDDHALLVAGWDGETLAAAGRLVLPRPGERLPTETHFDVTVEPAGQVVNLDRMVVARPYTDPCHRTTVALAFACWQELRRHGFHYFAGVVTPGVLRLYRRAGWQVTPIGPARSYWGELRTPCLFDPSSGFTGSLTAPSSNHR